VVSEGKSNSPHFNSSDKRIPLFERKCERRLLGITGVSHFNMMSVQSNFDTPWKGKTEVGESFDEVKLRTTL
jgi:hypothetical protein